MPGFGLAVVLVTSRLLGSNGYELAPWKRTGAAVTPRRCVIICRHADSCRPSSTSDIRIEPPFSAFWKIFENVGKIGREGEIKWEKAFRAFRAFRGGVSL